LKKKITQLDLKNLPVLAVLARSYKEYKNE
jgi:hypothetical protein